MGTSLKTVLFLGFFALYAGQNQAQADKGGPVVVELFTSQGCSSCPPADRYLSELADRDDILALSLHVDYWDYIGWKDPFSSPAYSQRQREYRPQFDLRYVYTPQMVIQGAAQAQGADRPKVEKLIEKLHGRDRIAVGLGPGPRPGTLSVTLPATFSEDVRVLLLTYDRKHLTSIKRGENEGIKLINRNVVRSMEPLQDWSNATPFTAAMPESGAGTGGAAVLVQSRDTGRILGAARFDFKDGR